MVSILFVDRFRRIFIETFNRDLTGLPYETPLSSLGDESSVDDFFDKLEFEFPGDLDDEMRHRLSTLGMCHSWATEQCERESEEKSEDSIPNAFHWRDEISALQRGILTISKIIGPILFFFGVQLTIRDQKELGGALSGIGMFIAVQMFWGVKSCYNWLEKRRSSLLQSPGYRGLFWIFVLIAYAVDALSIATVITWLSGE